MRHRKTSKHGFSLVEVIVAMMIFGIAVIALTQAYVNTLLSLDLIRSEGTPDADLRFVRQQVLQIGTRDELEQGGEIETLAHGTAIWEAEVEPTTVSSLMDLNLIITLNPPEGEEEIHTYNLKVLRPTWAEEADNSDILDENRQRLEDIRGFKDWQ